MPDSRRRGAAMTGDWMTSGCWLFLGLVYVGMSVEGGLKKIADAIRERRP